MNLQFPFCNSGANERKTTLPFNFSVDLSHFRLMERNFEYHSARFLPRIKSKHVKNFAPKNYVGNLFICSFQNEKKMADVLHVHLTHTPIKTVPMPIYSQRQTTTNKLFMKWELPNLLLWLYLLSCLKSIFLHLNYRINEFLTLISTFAVILTLNSLFFLLFLALYCYQTRKQ